MLTIIVFVFRAIGPGSLLTCSPEMSGPGENGVMSGTISGDKTSPGDLCVQTCAMPCSLAVVQVFAALWKEWRGRKLNQRAE